ncbi:hypothetical protein HDV00_007474 [Rhizophlyctis rosea]|nr:hypothetical protein HDV00_007474 [Rhizophlyctis rosea]
MVQQIKALIANKAGPLSEVLSVEEVPKPTPGAGQVLIRVHSAAVNPLDWKQAQYGLFVQSWPLVLGYDASGVVAEVGEGVTEFAVGDEVFGCGSQAFAEYALVNAVRLYKKPKNVSFEAAATLSVGLSTAVMGLFLERGLGLGRKAQNAEWILVTGGATSVGAFTVQLAARAGYRVIATASKKNEKYLKSLGASHVIDYSLPADQQVASIQHITDNKLRYAIDLANQATSELAAKAVNPSLKPLVILFAHFGPFEVPAGVEHRAISSGEPAALQPIKDYVLAEVLPALESGEIKANNVQLVEGGLEGLKEGLRLSAEGKVSAAKVVANI